MARNLIDRIELKHIGDTSSFSQPVEFWSEYQFTFFQLTSNRSGIWGLFNSATISQPNSVRVTTLTDGTYWLTLGINQHTPASGPSASAAITAPALNDEYYFFAHAHAAINAPFIKFTVTEAPTTVGSGNPGYYSMRVTADVTGDPAQFGEGFDYQFFSVSRTDTTGYLPGYHGGIGQGETFAQGAGGVVVGTVVRVPQYDQHDIIVAQVSDDAKTWEDAPNRDLSWVLNPTLLFGGIPPAVIQENVDLLGITEHYGPRVDMSALHGTAQRRVTETLYPATFGSTGNFYDYIYQFPEFTLTGYDFVTIAPADGDIRFTNATTVVIDANSADTARLDDLQVGDTIRVANATSGNVFSREGTITAVTEATGTYTFTINNVVNTGTPPSRDSTAGTTFYASSGQQLAAGDISYTIPSGGTASISVYPTAADTVSLHAITPNHTVNFSTNSAIELEGNITSITALHDPTSLRFNIDVSRYVPPLGGNANSDASFTVNVNHAIDSYSPADTLMCQYNGAKQFFRLFRPQVNVGGTPAGITDAEVESNFVVGRKVNRGDTASGASYDA